MVHASIEHPPVVGGKVRRLDDSETRQVRGVQQTVTIDPPGLPLMFQTLGGVAVVADFYHATAAVYHKAVVDDRGRPTMWRTSAPRTVRPTPTCASAGSAP
jgi:isoquinoline 1-oxidoreductase beta subunit